MISESEPMLLLLQRATHATLQALTTELVDLDLTASDLNALANLADGRPRTVSELGAATGGKPTTLTGVLDRLERRGYLTRGIRAGDRRAVLLTLTDAGNHAATTIQAAITNLEQRLLADVPAAMITTARTVLHSLASLTKASA